MHSAITGNWNCLRGVNAIILHVRLDRYRIRNFNVMICNWIVFVFNRPVLLELSLHLFINLHMLSSLYIQPDGSAVSVLQDFAVFNHDFPVFNGIGSVAEGSPNSLVLSCKIGRASW